MPGLPMCSEVYSNPSAVTTNWFSSSPRAHMLFGIGMPCLCIGSGSATASDGHFVAPAGGLVLRRRSMTACAIARCPPRLGCLQSCMNDVNGTLPLRTASSNAARMETRGML
eukprot:scaffold66413_cov60-Phaeocystis_antarctica.AAC.6